MSTDLSRRKFWLKRAIFVGTLSAGAPKQVVLRYYKVA